MLIVLNHIFYNIRRKSTINTNLKCSNIIFQVDVAGSTKAHIGLEMTVTCRRNYCKVNILIKTARFILGVFLASTHFTIR